MENKNNDINEENIINKDFNSYENPYAASDFKENEDKNENNNDNSDNNKNYDEKNENGNKIENNEEKNFNVNKEEGFRIRCMWMNTLIQQR